MSTTGTEPRSAADVPATGRSRRLVLVVLILMGVGVVAFLGGAWWDSLARWIDTAGILGYLVYFLSFVFLTTFCFPVSVLGFSAGAMFGPARGLLILLLSGVASGAVMFCLGRCLFRDLILRWVSNRPRLAALDRLAEERALRLNFLARLSPLNYGVVCYTLASGRSSVAAYFLGLLAILPGMTAQVWAGALTAKARLAVTGQEQQSILEWAVLGGGLVFFGLFSWQVGRLVRDAWQEAGSEDDGTGPAGTRAKD